MTSPYGPQRVLFSEGRWVLWLVGLGIILILTANISKVLAGHMPGNDDMLRLQQVRDLMAGQNWFNTDQSRFLTPEGGDIHWSRLPDIFLSAIIMVLHPLLGADGAEKAALILWPLSLMAVTLAGAAMALHRLGANLAGQAAGLAFIGFSSAALNFTPGRIDHHNLIVALMSLALAATLSPRLSWRSGLIAAFCTAAMLSTAIESLPYVAVIVLTLGVFWIINGAAERSRLMVFGASLVWFAFAFYALDAPGIGDERFVCDAYGRAHLASFAAGGLAMVVLAVASTLLNDWGKRLVASMIAGGCVIALFINIDPSCFSDPYAGLSDQARTVWLNVVSEAHSFDQVWKTAPDRAIARYGFVIAGLVAAGMAVWSAPPGLRLARGAFMLLLLVSAAVTVWQVRGATFSHLFAAMAAGLIIGILFDTWRKSRDTKPLILLVACAVAISPTSWISAGQIYKQSLRASEVSADAASACADPAFYLELKADKPRNIFSSIDLGMEILVSTEHNVYSGPYHRNVGAIERAISVFLKPADEAHTTLLNAGADYLLFCSTLPETRRYARLSPNGFAADLNASNIPEWLNPITVSSDGNVTLYRISTGED